MMLSFHLQQQPGCLPERNRDAVEQGLQILAALRLDRPDMRQPCFPRILKNVPASVAAPAGISTFQLDNIRHRFVPSEPGASSALPRPEIDVESFGCRYPRRIGNSL